MYISKGQTCKGVNLTLSAHLPLVGLFHSYQDFSSKPLKGYHDISICYANAKYQFHLYQHLLCKC